MASIAKDTQSTPSSATTKARRAADGSSTGRDENGHGLKAKSVKAKPGADAGPHVASAPAKPPVKARSASAKADRSAKARSADRPVESVSGAISETVKSGKAASKASSKPSKGKGGGEVSKDKARARSAVDKVSAKAARSKRASQPAAAPAAQQPTSVKASTPGQTSDPSNLHKSAAGRGAGAMIGVAAAGLAAGIVANLGRKAAVQAPSVMAGDWMEALKSDHKATLALIDHIGRTTVKQKAKRTLLLSQLRHAVSKHAFTEENVIYPALREWGDKADADALAHEQSYHKQFLYELEGLDPASSAFDEKIADFRADLVSHMKDEEDKIFPQLHAGLTAEKNKALTALANREGFRLA